MNIFMKYDRIRCIKTSVEESITVGETYMVRDVDPNDGCVVIKNDYGKMCFYSSLHFESMKK